MFGYPEIVCGFFSFIYSLSDSDILQITWEPLTPDFSTWIYTNKVSEGTQTEKLAKSYPCAGDVPQAPDVCNVKLFLLEGQVLKQGPQEVPW